MSGARNDIPPLQDRIAQGVAIEVDIPVDEMCVAIAKAAIMQLTTPDPEMILAGARAMAKAGCTPMDVWAAMVEQAKHPRPRGIRPA